MLTATVRRGVAASDDRKRKTTPHCDLHVSAILRNPCVPVDHRGLLLRIGHGPLPYAGIVAGSIDLVVNQ